MADPLLMLGTSVIVPTGGLGLAWSAVVVDSAAATQAISGSALLVAGTYSPDGFINHCASKLRTSIFNAIVAEAWFTTEPVNAAAIPFKLGLPDSLTAGVGTNPLRIKCASTGGALHNANATSWQSFSLVNTSNNWCWLGLAYPGEARALTISAGGFDDTGRMQPRWVFFFKAHFKDTGDLPLFANHYTTVLDGGRAVQYSIGRGPLYERQMSLQAMPQHINGTPWVVGRFSDFGATRELLEYVTQDETLFTGISGTDVRSDFLTSPVYLKSGKWWARYRDTTGGAFRMMDVFPSTLSPVAGEPIQAYSESMALMEEWRRTGKLFRYEAADLTGTIQFVWKCYAPNYQGAWSPQPRKRPNSLHYDLDFSMILIPNPELATP